jgi:type II secretory pathway component PulM
MASGKQKNISQAWQSLRMQLVGFWQSLTRREQLLTALAGFASVLFLLYELVILPVGDYKQASRRSLEVEQQRLSRIIVLLETLASRDVEASGELDGTGEVKPLRSVVLETAALARVAIERVQPGDARFTIFVSRALPADILGWLQQLQGVRRYEILQLVMRKTGKGDAAVSAQVTFRD